MWMYHEEPFFNDGPKNGVAMIDLQLMVQWLKSFLWWPLWPGFFSLVMFGFCVIAGALSRQKLGEAGCLAIDGDSQWIDQQ